MFSSIDDTIAAISTPRGFSGIGVVRLSGPKAAEIASAVFSPSKSIDLNKAPTHTLHHGWIKNGPEVIDEAVLAIMKKPSSYTGDDTVEISTHGSPVIMNKLLKLLLERGARLAEPGEFTFRAFINGRMDLAKAESVCDLIKSKTEKSLASALYQFRGGLSDKINDYRARLIELLSHIEVSIDYSEEDMKFLTGGQVALKLKTLQDEINALIQTASKGIMVKDGIRVVIAGKPNAGKSSLLNALLERDRAIVADFPGTTRDVIEENLDLNGFLFVIMDTAGLGLKTGDPVEGLSRERTLECIKNSDIIIWVIDSSSPLADADFHIAQLLKPSFEKKGIIAVFNKSDLPQVVPGDALAGLCGLSGVPVKVSCLTREGMENLENAMITCAGIEDTGPACGISNIRHLNALKQSCAAIAMAADSVKNGGPEEITAHHARHALDCLGEITGETATDEILNNIFSKFCVGK